MSIAKDLDILMKRGLRLKQAPKRSKFNVDNSKIGKLSRTIDGHVFASMGEANRYSELVLLQKGNYIRDLKVHQSWRLAYLDFDFGTYTDDFSYYEVDRNGQDGEFIVEDFKGNQSGPVYELYKIKTLLLRLIYGIRVREIRAPKGRRR